MKPLVACAAVLSLSLLDDGSSSGTAIQSCSPQRTSTELAIKLAGSSSPGSLRKQTNAAGFWS